MVDYDAVRRLSHENARACRSMIYDMGALSARAGLNRTDIDSRMERPGLAIRVEGNVDGLTLDELRAYASAVGARLTFTVEADPDVDATA